MVALGKNQHGKHLQTTSGAADPISRMWTSLGRSVRRAFNSELWFPDRHVIRQPCGLGYGPQEQGRHRDHDHDLHLHQQPPLRLGDGDGKENDR